MPISLRGKEETAHWHIHFQATDQSHKYFPINWYLFSGSHSICGKILEKIVKVTDRVMIVHEINS